jgi:hypothetical protein
VAIDPTQIEQCLLEKVRQRGLDKSICPSEVARALGGENWQSLMPQVRSIGARLAKSGLIVALQKGHVIDTEAAKGPIRFRVTKKGLDAKSEQ